MPNEPTLGELQRLIERNHFEVREDYASIVARMDQYVLREVYSADEERRNQRFGNIEEELRRNRSMRILIFTLLVTAILGPIATWVVTYLATRSLM